MREVQCINKDGRNIEPKGLGVSALSLSSSSIAISCWSFDCMCIFWWQRTQDFSRTFNFTMLQLESSDRLTVSSSLYSSNVSLIVFFICFTLSVFDNIDVLSFQNPGLRGFECKKEKMSPKSGQFFYPGLISATFGLFATLWFTKKKSSQHCTFGRLRLHVNRLL